ncbi:MAG: non-hydrolyzing UDP-N-acetylglucosamine 2-epimerase [Methylocystis sp.]|uniref:non-hydrolyzing UDP-N-acetylglucosamine 2-epimerase n=1 Tax=Methylocystis sp. TaxID=1911079 RepID=UPI003DA2B0DB
MTGIPPAGRRRVDCVVGARPNFMKIAPILRALDATERCAVRLIHTGQHYDESMNAVFFEELGIRAPDVNLEVGSGTNTEQTARIMLALEPLLVADRPDMLLVVGDVNSTVASALVAAKLLVALAHVEAGLRSHDRAMPEEINRLVTDRLSDLLLTTEREAGAQLQREGVPAESIRFVGNVMIDTLNDNLARARPARATIAQLAGGGQFAEDATRDGYGLVTLHRPSNVDDPAKLAGLVAALVEISRELPLLFAMHPRTRARIEAADLAPQLAGARILATPPLGYLDMLGLMREARLVVTDSGGMQEETTALGVPCLTVRDNTERPITITEGTNTLVGSAPDALLRASREALNGAGKRGRIPELWDGKAADRIVRHVLDFLAAR